MSERSGGREQSEQSGASERVSGASEQANGRASGPVFTSRFLAYLNHCALTRVFRPGIQMPLGCLLDEGAKVSSYLVVQRRIFAEPHHHRRSQGIREPSREIEMGSGYVLHYGQK